MAQGRVTRIGVSLFRDPLRPRIPDQSPTLAKTSRPRLAAAYPRTHLFDVLDLARRRHAATLVMGPPGAGKTTLISSYLESRELRHLWYRVDSADDDIVRFFHYFSQAAPAPSTESAKLPAFDAGAARDPTEFSRHFFREFYAKLDAPLVVVLDNYEQLPADSPLQEVLRVACEETPPDHHVILVSRNDCPPSLVRMRLNQALAVIDSQDLALTAEETQGIAAMHGVRLPDPAARLAVHARSAGWIMGLIVMLECIRRDTPTKPNFALQAGHERLLFDYFAHEVLKTIDPQCRTCLLQMAFLPEMTVQRVTALTGTPRSGELLLEMMRKNYFVTRYEAREAAFQFHPLFREFLLRQAEREFGSDISTCRSKAADVLVADGDFEAAVALLEQSQDWPRLADLILEHAPALKSQGRDATLNVWLGKLPPALLDADCWLHFWHGSAQVTLDPEAGQAILGEAYRRFRSAGDVVGMALSWSSLVEAIFVIHKNLVELDAWIAEYDERLAAKLERLPAHLKDRVELAYFNCLSFRAPANPQLPQSLRKVRAMLDSERRAAQRAVLRYHLVQYHLLRGEHAEAEAVLGMLHHADDAHGRQSGPLQLLDHVSEASVALHTGMRDRCLDAVERGLRAAEGFGDRAVESVLHQIGAAMCHNRGDLDRADAFLAHCERLAEAMPYIDRGTYYAVAAWRRFQGGELAISLTLMRQAVAASEARGTAYYISVDNLAYGLLLHLCGRSDEARRHLEYGRALGASIRNPLTEFIHELFSAYIRLETEAGEAQNHLQRAMRIGNRHGYMHFLVFPPRLIARLCLEALEADIESDYVRSLITRNELTPDPAWRHSEAWPWPLRIYTLGRFSVVQHGKALRFSGKSQKRPMELLKALIALGGRDVAEARLSDALWPEAEGDASAQALSTTLFRLRKLLGEHAIRRQDGRVTLDPAYCWVDCWQFERVASDDSMPAATRSARLRHLYQGEFLEDVDTPWAKRLRERLHARFTRFVSETGSYFSWLLMSLVGM